MLCVKQAFRTHRSVHTQASSESFTSAYETLSSQLFHDRLNRANRALVFRPRRAKELLSRKNPILVDGKPLEPMTYKGTPGQSDLSALLTLVESEEDLLKAKGIVKGYANYQSDNIKSSHLIKYLRVASKLGKYNDAASVILTGYEFKSIRNKQVLKEMLRIQAVRAASSLGVSKIPRSKHSLFAAWSKVPEKSRQNDLDVNLSLLYGLAGLAHNTSDAAAKTYIEKKIGQQLENVKVVLAKNPPQPTEGLPAYILDLTLGKKALKAIGAEAEVAQVSDILQTVAAPIKNPAGLVESYVFEIEGGFAAAKSEKTEEETTA